MEKKGMKVIGSHCRNGSWLVLAGLGVLSLAGCSSNKLYPVHGQLVYEDNGAPVTELAGLDVTFTSDKLGMSSSGTSQADGTFDLRSNKSTDGPYPRDYAVTRTQRALNP